MPIVAEGGVVMSTKHFFVLLLCFTSASVLTSGCKMQDHQRSPNVATAPPYWQSHSQQAQSQLDDMRAFHKKESAEMTEEMNVFRNREMERLTTAGEEPRREQNKEMNEVRIVPQQEIIAKTPVPREKWNWATPATWFKKKDKNSTPLVSKTDQSVR